jgi:hypothetical protein
MNSKVLTHCIVVLVGFTTIAITYWVAADPPNVWFLVITAAGLLFGVGTIIYRNRAGHFRR